tara:strand:- start:1523 stop:1933 length:411 start_codon:yes stop_codon:yes gene_type:complete
MDTLRTIKNNNKNIISQRVIDMLYGFSVSITHFVLICAVFFATLLSFDIKTLVFTSIISLAILIINIVLHDCPLSQIEEQRLGDSFVDWLSRGIPINYNRERRYELQLQYILLVLAMLSSKIIFILLKNDLKNILL